ncbi:MAG: ion transporter [Woeseiaceae bacterium]|nr:ion transporter [Woeseiaceae bacterium]
MLDDISKPGAIGANRRSSTTRATVFRLLETAQPDDTASRVVDILLIALIICSVAAVVLESMPAVEEQYGDAIYWFDVFVIAVFSVEYLLRVWSCIEDRETSGGNAFTRRFRFIFSFHAIIDLLAILPFYLSAFVAPGVADMRLLRAIRLIRVLKLTRYFATLNMLIIAVKENGRALAASFLILVTIMLFAAAGMYHFERASQPQDFGSIPAAMWWAFATLTTVGYGDVTPITNGGKIFGALIAVVGIGMVALPTSILATGYARQLKLSMDRYADKASEALDDGILSDDELYDLEELRQDLGLDRTTASQILDAGMVQAALQQEEAAARCPHCNKQLD